MMFKINYKKNNFRYGQLNGHDRHGSNQLPSGGYRGCESAHQDCGRKAGSHSGGKGHRARGGMEQAARGAHHPDGGDGDAFNGLPPDDDGDPVHREQII